MDLFLIRYFVPGLVGFMDKKRYLVQPASNKDTGHRLLGFSPFHIACFILYVGTLSGLLLRKKEGKAD